MIYNFIWDKFASAKTSMIWQYFIILNMLKAKMLSINNYKLSKNLEVDSHKLITFFPIVVHSHSA